MSIWSADRVVLSAGPSDRGPLAGYRTRAGRVAGIVFTGIWLAYLIGPVVDLITQHYSATDRAAGLSIIAAFCVIYVTLVPNWPMGPRYAHACASPRSSRWRRPLCILFGGMGVASLWIFVLSASGLLVANHRWAVRVIAAVVACYVFFCYTGHVAMTDFPGNLLPVTFLGLVMIGLRRQLQLTNELHRAREEVAQLAASEERVRLARDMHDLTGQSLSVITLKSELATRLLSRLPDSLERDRVREEIEGVAAVSRADAARHPRGDQRLPAADARRGGHHRPRGPGQRGYRRGGRPGAPAGLRHVRPGRGGGARLVPARGGHQRGPSLRREALPHQPHQPSRQRHPGR